MGWLGTLGKIAGFAAAPFTGGLSLLAEPAIGAIEGAQHGGGWSGALKGGAVGGLEAAIPFGLGQLAGPGSVIGSMMGNTASKIVPTVAGQMVNGQVNKLAAKAGTSPVNAPSSMGGSNSGPNDLFGGGGYGPGGQQGYDEEGNPTTDPSQVYQDNNGNVVSSSPDTGYIGYDVNGNPTNDPKAEYQNMNGDIVGSDGSGQGGTGTGVISKLLGAFKSSLGQANGFGDASKVLGGIENGEANNRYKKGEMTQGYDKLMLQAQQDRNLNESDAMKKMAQTSYLLGGGSHFNPSSVKLAGGESLPDFGIGPRPASDAQKTAAGTLQGQLMTRLAPGGSYMPTKPDYLNRGAIENIGQYGGLATGIGGVLASIFGPKNQGINPVYKGTPPIIAPNNGAPQPPQDPSYSPYDVSNT